ncbi:MAG: STAS domain-containing protein [Deltaproteobacteria bacterium]|nr:STAS domain-containing protein [Deltaproteobacteria bacterium]
MSGRLSLTNAHRAHAEMLAACRRSAHEEFVVDLSGLTYLDGAGVAVLPRPRTHQPVGRRALRPHRARRVRRRLALAGRSRASDRP